MSLVCRVMSLHHICESKTSKLVLLPSVFSFVVVVEEFQLLMLIEGRLCWASLGLEL